MEKTTLWPKEENKSLQELEAVHTELYKIMGALQLIQRVEPDGIDRPDVLVSDYRNGLEVITDKLDLQCEQLEHIIRNLQAELAKQEGKAND